MTRRWWLAAWLCGALLGCDSDDPIATVSTRPGDASADHDASSSESPMHAGSGGSTAGHDASTGGGGESQDAAGPLPPAPQTDGVHLSVGAGPYETASEAFYFETDRPGIQGELSGGVTLRIELSDQLGVVRCSDGASIAYEVPEGGFVANRDNGSCSIDVEAFGTAAGDPIEATFSATVVRAFGEIADELELHGRVQVGHP